jgi:endonuclease/exonuclease/phosphatase family metal-dependent hydrolase
MARTRFDKWMQLLFAALAATLLLARLSPAKEPVELTVVTFNVLVDVGDYPGIPRWIERKDLCLQVLRDTNADLIGLQETTPGQLKFLAEQLPQCEVIAYKGYPDAALLYRKDRFEKLEQGHWWLSPTPQRVSVGFGNALPRLVVWARLKHKATGRELYAFNTHFDNSMPSQVRMAELCQQQLAPFVAQGLPMIFTGDFNTHQTRGDYARLVSGGWQDSYVASDKASPSGRDDNVPTTLEGDGRIDHIFYHGQALVPIEWRRLESPQPEKPLSDHYPVLARFRLN